MLKFRIKELEILFVIYKMDLTCFLSSSFLNIGSPAIVYPLAM